MQLIRVLGNSLEKIITKKTEITQPFLSQILFINYISYPFGVSLKVISLYQNIVFYANLFLAEHIFVLGLLLYFGFTKM